eukprot:1310325-Pyramimonas_sp.AAC.1
MARGRHANHDPREGCAEMPEAAMRTLPLAPSVELPMGPRSSSEVCRNGLRPPCEPCHWRLR